jgi:hypothetical protein
LIIKEKAMTERRRKSLSGVRDLDGIIGKAERGAAFGPAVGQAIGALLGKKGRLTKKQYGVLKIPGLRSKRKKKNGPS